MRSFGALLRRELITPLRRRRMIIVQLGLAVLFGLLVIVRWPTDGQTALAGARSQQIFRLFSYGLMITLLMLLPVFPATSIVSERKRGTLALLLNTPTGPLRIFAAKLLAVLGLAGMVLAMSLPAAAACYRMGGLAPGDILDVYWLLLLVALQYASVGLLISSFSQSIDSAVRLTYGFVLATSLLTLGPHYFFQGTGGTLASISETLRSLSPIASLPGTGNLGGQGLISSIDVQGRYMIWSLLCTAIASIWTVSRLNHRLFDQSRAAGTMSDDLSLPIRILRRVFFLVDPQKRSVGIPNALNPVMVKEFRCRRFGRLHWLLRLVAVCAVLSLALTYATTAGTFDWGVEMIGGIMVVMQVALIVLIAPSLSAGLLSAETEAGGWQLLQTTPLSVGRIIGGKLLSAFLPLLLILCATMPGYLVMAYIDPGMWLQVRLVLVCLALTAVFSMLCSAAVGCLSLRTAAATASAYGVLLAISGLPLLVWMGRDAPFGHGVVEASLSLSSVAAAFSVIRIPGFQDYDLIPANWWLLIMGCVISLAVLLVRTYRLARPQ